MFPNELGCELRLENAPNPGAGLELPNPMELEADPGFGVCDVKGGSPEPAFPSALDCEFRLANAPKPGASCELPTPLVLNVLLAGLRSLSNRAPCPKVEPEPNAFTGLDSDELPKNSPPKGAGSSDAIESSAGPSGRGVKFKLLSEAGEEDAAPNADGPNLAGPEEAKAANPPGRLVVPKAENP